MEAIEFDITDQIDTLNKLASSMNFIISKSINDIAFGPGRKALSKEMNTKFEARDKKFNSPNAIRVQKSTKLNLTVSLFHFKEELGLQQFGGVETPKGKKLAIPIRKNMAKYANVPNNKRIPKSLKIDTILDKAPKHKGQAEYKTRGVKPFVMSRGVFIRTSEGLRMLYVFQEKAAHTKRLLNFQNTIEKVYNTKLERHINRNYLKILKG